MQKSSSVKSREAVGIEYLFDAPPHAGELIEVAPGVHWLRMPLPFALEHINLWLLDDNDGWTIVDCGFGSDETRACWEAIFAQRLGGKPVTRILVTHFHPDHFGLAAWLAERWRVPVRMTAPEFAAARGWFAARDPFRRAAHVALYRRHGLALADDHARGNLFKRGVPVLPESIAPLADGQRIAIGGRDWRVIAGYGHSPEHAALYCDALKVLIAGDMVLPRISTNVSVQAAAPDADPLGLFLDSLARYAELDADARVLPSHGLPFRGLRERIAALTAHHRERLDEIHAACARPHTGAELMPLIFRRALDAQQTMFAMGETLSHANYLHHRRRLERMHGSDGIYRFVRA